MGYEDIAWLPVCAGLTAFGLLMTWLVGRRRGAAGVMRGLAWSLIPIAAWLTGLIEVAWTVGGAVATWALRLVFSPVVWLGIAVAGLCVVLFVVSGALRRRGLAGGRRAAESGQTVQPGQQAPKELDKEKQPSGTKADPSADDFAEIEDILRRRGIS